MLLQAKVRGVALAVLLAAAACAPRVRPLTGVPFAGTLPRSLLPKGHARIVFRWSYDDPLFAANGEGVARIAPPDSVRLDFFVDGGVGSGGAILIGDAISTAADDGRRYLPPVPLLWAALGVLRVAGPDSLVRIDRDTLRVDIGRNPTFRAVFADTALLGLERIDGGRIRERVVRQPDRLTYRNFSAHRTLTLTALRRFEEPGFDPAIWRP